MGVAQAVLLSIFKSLDNFELCSSHLLQKDTASVGWKTCQDTQIYKSVTNAVFGLLKRHCEMSQK